MIRFIFLFCALFASVALGANSAYTFREDRVPAGEVFRFMKSNRDGSHSSAIDVYIASTQRIESLKRWNEPADRATLVVAEMDWRRFSVSSFTVWELNCGRAAEPRNTLRTNADDTLSVSSSGQVTPIEQWPWHSYDFDFMSLNLTWPHLANAEETFTFERMDIMLHESPLRFASLGPVHVRFEGTEVRAGKEVRRYSVGGPGLSGATGTWWSDAATGLLVEYEFPVPDEPGYRDMRLRLVGSRRMTAAEWTTYKQSSLCESIDSTPSER